MTKKQKLEAILKAIDITIDKAILKRSADYLKPFKRKPWHDKAVQYLAAFQVAVSEILCDQKEEYIKIIKKQKKLFVENQKVEKGNIEKRNTKLGNI